MIRGGLIMNKLTKIELEDLEDLFQEHLIHDFAQEELPPLFALKRHFIDGSMFGYFFYLNGVDLAYAIMFEDEKSVLLSLFGVYKEHRNQGYGTLFLEELINLYPDKQIILEVNKPNTSDAYENETRLRRIKFYQRCGFKLYEEVDFSIFKHSMYLMALTKEPLSYEQIKESVCEVYRVVLSEELMEYVEFN